MMKKFLLVAVLLVMVMVTPSLVMAGLVVNSSAYSFYPGGEFNLSGGAPSNGDYDGYTKNKDGITPSFQTFCLEKNEFFTPGNTYNFTGNNAAVAGGLGGGSPDPLSQGTAYLYSEFAKGSLGALNGSYFAASNRQTEAGKLQDAIWALENEIDAPLAGLNLYYDLALTKGGKDDADGGYLGVYALNLTIPGQPGPAANAQDMLYYDKTGAIVPIPPTAYLLGAGLLGLVGLRRRFKK